MLNDYIECPQEDCALAFTDNQSTGFTDYFFYVIRLTVNDLIRLTQQPGGGRKVATHG